jgi:hypothetical protein
MGFNSQGSPLTNHPSWRRRAQVRFTYAQYDKRTPGLFKVETTKHKMISLCSKMYCAAEDTDYCECCACKNIECKCVKKCKCAFKFSCKGIKKQVTIVIIKKFMMYYLINMKIKY